MPGRTRRLVGGRLKPGETASRCVGKTKDFLLLFLLLPSLPLGDGGDGVGKYGLINNCGLGGV